MPCPDFIAPPDNLLGLLQRGRGAGYLGALTVSKAEAHDHLVSCITADARMDGQVESRDHYYAALAVEVGLPLEPLAEHLRQHDDPTQFTGATNLTVTTLTELARRDYRNAKELLCDYIGWGQWWNWPLHDLLNLPDEGLRARIARTLEQRFSTADGLDEAMATWPAEGFQVLSCFSARIEASLVKAYPEGLAVPKNVLPDLEALSPRELLGLANQENFRGLGKVLAKVVTPAEQEMLVAHVSLSAPFASHVALTGLAQLAPPGLCGWLAELWLMAPKSGELMQPSARLGSLAWQQGVLRAMLAMPSRETLLLARDWIVQPDLHKQSLGKELLKEYATMDDVPVLRAFLRDMLAEEDAEYGCYLIKAFFHLPGIGPIPELSDIYHQFRFSLGRSYAAEAIQVTAPEQFKVKFAVECLWDCEEGTRELGAKFAPIESEQVRRQIQFIAQDPIEEEATRTAAQERLSA